MLTRGFSQLYLSLGDVNDDGSVAVRLYYKPMVLLIWIGAIVMMFGGALSLSDRRLRVGAPKTGGKAGRAGGGVEHAPACDRSFLCLPPLRRAVLWRCSPKKC